MTDQQMKSISVEDLLRSGNISRRTYNTLVKARLRTLFDLRKYKNGLRRLFPPQSTNFDEVSLLIRNAADMDHLPNIAGRLFMDPIVDKSKGEQLLDNLDNEQMALLELAYDSQLKRLLASRLRAHTVVANALAQVPVNVFLREFLYDEDDKIMILYNVGRTSVEHFARVKKAMLEVVESMQQQPEMVRYRIFLLQTKGRFDDDQFILDFFKAHQRLPLLYFLQQLIINNKKRLEIKAFLKRYDVFEGKVKLDPTPIQRSAYTIATYSNNIYDALFDPSVGWETFDPIAQTVINNDWVKEDLKAYILQPFVTETDRQITDVIVGERLLLAPVCIVGLMGKLLAERYISLGGYPRSMLVAKAERWRHIYLIDRQLDEKYAFGDLFIDFKDREYAKSTDNHAVGMGEYIVTKHPEREDDEDMELAKGIIGDIVTGELMLEKDDQQRIIVPRMVEKSLADRLYDILSVNNENPMALTRLTEIINSGDGRKYVKATVSLALNKDPRFVNNGKKGLYALTEWHLPYFGSNVDIIYQVLSQSETPMESDEILDVLNQYPYNESLGKNELSSVISISKDIFRKLGFGYYGLVEKEYDSNLIRPLRNHFEADLKAFRDFLETYQRIPSSKNNAEEKRLIYWFSRKRKEYNENAKWTAQKRELFKEIIDLYEKYLSQKEEEQPIPETASPEPDTPVAPSEGTTVQDATETLQTDASPSEDEMTDEDASLAEDEMTDDASIAIAPEMLGEPPMALFALDEDSPFIAPDNTGEPPAALFALDEDSPFIAPDNTEEPPADLFVNDEEPDDELPAQSELPSSGEHPVDDSPSECPADNGSSDETLLVDSTEDSVKADLPVSTISDDAHDGVERYEEVYEFVKVQHREPLALFTAEHQLAQWLQEQKKRWHEGRLSPKEEEKLLALRDLLW